MTDLQREAREAAAKLWLGLDPFPIMARSAFVDGYLAAAAPREQEIEELRAELAKTKLPIWMLREEHEQEVAALRGELADWEESARKAAGERCEDEIHCCCVPYLRVEIERLRAREKLWSEYVALMVESEKLTITMFHVHRGRFPVEMIERGKRLRYALGLE